MKKMPIWAKLLGVVAVLAILTGIVWDFSIQLQGILRNKTYETMAETSVDYNSSFFELLKDEEIETTELTIQMILKIFVIVFLVLAFIIFSKYRHSKEIAAANQECQALLSNINGGMMITKLSKNLLALKPYYFSKLCEEITGYTLSEIEKFHDGLNEIVYPEDKENVQKTYLQQISKGDTYRLTYRVVQKNGEIVWIMDNGYMLKNEDGEELNYSIITDITSLKQQEEALRVSSERFRIAIEASKGTIFEVDVKSQIYTHFENAERIFGISNEKILEDTRKFSELSPEEYKKATSAYFSHPDDAEAIGKAFSEVLKGKPIGYEARMRRFDGSYIWCKIDLGIILDSEGEPMRLVGYIVDISETKKENEMLKKQVKIDPLTGLYNKTATMILANSILEKEPEGRHSLIVLDIDNFKGVNDTLGHSFGDAVLVDVSAKLKAVFRSDDVVGRIGGDEFAILMKNVPDTNRVLKKAAEISGIFRQTYAGEKENYKISCSMGIVMVENKDERFKTLFLKADAALYQAKQNGKDMFVLYDSDKINNYMTLNAKPNDDVEFMKTHNSLQEQIFTLLYDAKDFESSINMALVTIGQKYNVSRTYVFENDEKNEYTSNTYEWCNTGIKPQIDILKKLAIGESGDSFLDCFDKDGLLYCSDINQVSPYVKKVLEEQDIVSALMLAIKNNEKIVGFIGFDECTRKRIWSAEEIEVLSTLARILGVFLLKKKAESSRVENLSNRIKILDILPVYICVVNPENHSLEYVNKKMSSVLPSVKSGTFCYTTLRGGQHGPCQTCLVERIKRGDTDNLEIVNEDKSVRVKVNAQYIEWSEHKKMVLLYGNDEVEYRS